MSDEIGDFFDSAPSFKFENVGDTASGKILGLKKMQQTDFDTGEPLFWNNGSAREQVQITLDIDGEESRIYAKGKMQKAIKDALDKTGSKLQEGGTLSVTFTGEGEPHKKGANPPKLYTAAYEPGNAFEQVQAATPAAAPAAPAAPAEPQRPATIPQNVWATLSLEQKQDIAVA